MAYKFGGLPSSFRTRDVRVDVDGGDFVVRMREPTVDGQARILLAGVSETDRIGNLSGRAFVAAVEECITGWDGVLDQNDRPVPYSAARLLEVARTNPTSALVVLISHLYRAIAGFPDEPEPRQNAVEGAGGPAATGTTDGASAAGNATAAASGGVAATSGGAEKKT